MTKVLKTAAIVVGAVALIATGVGAAAGAGLIGAGVGASATVAGISAASLTTIGTIASVAATVLSLGAAALTKPPGVSLSGDQTKFTANLNQGIPYVIGRTAVAGFIVHRQTYDWSGSTNNTFQTFFGVWGGGGPYHAVEAFQVDGNSVTFSGDVGNDCAQGSYNDGHNTGWMWQRHQLGACPEPAALWATGYYHYPAGWSATAKLSGYAAFSWTLKFDPSGKAYPGAAVPQPRGVLQGALVYDPRQDSTYPGGSGACRALNEATYVYSENPALHALTWALGRWQNGKRVLGIGMAAAAIVMPAYVQAANVADANGWKIGGTVYSTDGKWDVLKKMLAACSGEPLQLGGTLSCVVDTPRVSLATIADNDIIGKCTIPGSPRIVDRINGVIPTYREETQDWQLVPAAKVSVADYVAFDGKPRTKALTWELVQQVGQVGQLATYAICNSREIDNIVLPLKLRWIGYQPGDALTVASSTVGLANQLVVLRKRSLDPATGAVTMTMRTETTGKHALALGQSTTAPPSPALQAVDRTQLLQPGISASWSAISDDDPIDHPRPADGADVTATALPAAYQAFTGRDAKTVVDDLGSAIDAIASETLRGATWRGESDTVLYMPDGTPVRTVVQALGTTVAGHTAYIAFLQQVGGDGSARATFTVNGDGHIVGWEALAGGSAQQNQLSFVASKFLFVDDSGANPVNALTYEGGGWRMKSIAVDTIEADTIEARHLKVNTAVVPVRYAATAPITGSYGGSADWTSLTPVEVFSLVVTMTLPGWIEINATTKQDFTNAQNAHPWRFQIYVNGTLVPETDVGGNAVEDVVPLQGAYFVAAAGDYTISYRWIAHSSIVLKGRSMFAKGLPNTE